MIYGRSAQRNDMMISASHCVEQSEDGVESVQYIRMNKNADFHKPGVWCATYSSASDLRPTE